MVSLSALGTVQLVIAIWRSTHDPFSSTTTTSTSSLRADSHPPTRQGRSSARREDRAAPRDFPRSIVPSYRVRVPPWSSSAQLQAYCLELQVLSAHMVFQRVDRGGFELSTATSWSIRCANNIDRFSRRYSSRRIPSVCLYRYHSLHGLPCTRNGRRQNKHKEYTLTCTTTNRHAE